MLWLDKHRPSTLSELTFHKQLSDHMKNLVKADDFPHLLLYGPSGAGKKTRILCLLKEIYGPGVEKVKIELRTFQVNNRKVEMQIISSAHHIEMNPADAGTADRLVVQEVLKEIAQSPPVVDASKGGRSFKVVVLSEVDNLSRGAQQSLRRTMEKYMRCCRLVLSCESLSRVIEPIRSRCLNLRVPSPSNNEVVAVLEDVCRRERLLPNLVLNQKIADSCSRNLRRAILTLEACKANRYPFEDDQAIQKTDWELFTAQIASEILLEQSPKRLMSIRGKLYELLSNCIPPEIILQTLATELMKTTDDTLKGQIISLAAQCDHSMRNGSKPILHLEAFVARFMSLYRHFMATMFVD
eukprot:c3190_g1_i1.p1 GENE.c3190_g1_i1~~c3190_g1_i1.p1  ORF type:complete len:367 (+),score=78.20 c3190_g1_i1:42-1103(+)